MTDLPTINRFAVVLMPTEACLAWINSCPGDHMTLAEVQKEPAVYLIPKGEAEPESYVRRHYKAMFEEELYSWYTDPDLWPKDLSFTTFKKFFTIHVSTMVFDLGKGMIEREEDSRMPKQRKATPATLSTQGRFHLGRRSLFLLLAVAVWPSGLPSGGRKGYIRATVP